MTHEREHDPFSPHIEDGGLDVAPAEAAPKATPRSRKGATRSAPAGGKNVDESDPQAEE